MRNGATERTRDFIVWGAARRVLKPRKALIEMAVTEVKLNDPLAVGVWAKMLNTETSKALPIAPLMGRAKQHYPSVGCARKIRW